MHLTEGNRTRATGWPFGLHRRRDDTTTRRQPSWGPLPGPAGGAPARRARDSANVRDHKPIAS
ncbi:MAG: hypothetical protein ACRD1U_06105, partial [Vicinamibacterales bacterium]